MFENPPVCKARGAQHFGANMVFLVNPNGMPSPKASGKRLSVFGLRISLGTVIVIHSGISAPNNWLFPPPYQRSDPGHPKTANLENTHLVQKSLDLLAGAVESEAISHGSILKLGAPRWNKRDYCPHSNNRTPVLSKLDPG